MGKQRAKRVIFPISGLDRQRSHREQAPFTATDALNVQSVGTLENRRRGGSRPGLYQAYVDQIGSGNPIRMLASMVLNLGDGWDTWLDVFSGLSLSDVWSQASWSSGTPNILQPGQVSVDSSVDDAAVVRDSLPVDTSQRYVVEAYILPWGGEFHGEYTLYARMDNSDPDIAQDGVEATLNMTGSTWNQDNLTLKSVWWGDATSWSPSTGSNQSVQPGWFRLEIVGDDVTVWFNNIQLISQTVDAQSGARLGFGLKCAVDDGLCIYNAFRAQYYSTANVNPTRTMIVASADGNLYREFPVGRLEQVSTNLTLRSDTTIDAVQSGQKLYIADHDDRPVAQGTDGSVSGAALDSATYADWTTLGISTYDDVAVLYDSTGSTVDGTYEIDSVSVDTITLASAPGDGNCSFRIERGPKIYDPKANTLSLWRAESGKGQVPSGCKLIARHIDRIYLGGDHVAPHAWYAARQTNPLDWDYAATDSQRAVAGPTSLLGVPGLPLTALAAHSDDYLIMGCHESMWRLRGDPAFDGNLDSVSQRTGIAGANAWTFGPAGELVFLSLDGLYVLSPGAGSMPVPVSYQRLPAELKNFNPSTAIINLEYDAQRRGVHVFLTPEFANERIHWWVDWDTKAFWPVSLQADHEPTAAHNLQALQVEDSGVLIGGRDGRIRKYNSFAFSDDGTAFASYVLLGPIPLAPDGMSGRVLYLQAELAENSGDVTWSVHPGLTFEAATNAVAAFTGTWKAGLNTHVRSVGRGQAVVLKLAGSGADSWSMEQVIIMAADAGQRRRIT